MIPDSRAPVRAREHLRVLMIHSLYRLENPSGENLSFEAERRLLADRGHDVLTYVRSSDEPGVAAKRAMAGARAIWATETHRDVAALLRRRQPDLVHLQNTFPMVSASALAACREVGVPVVQAVRNYRLLCANGMLYRQGAPCHDCVGRAPWRGVARRCYRDSAAASAVSAASALVHRRFRGAIDAYIAPSEFVRDMLVEAGFPSSAIAVKPNFLAPDPGPGTHAGDYVVYAGRLTAEKGVGTLAEAWGRLDSVPLRVVGDGPLRDTVRRVRGVEWVGRRSLEETLRLIGDARTVVVPSEWDEPFGRVVIEAFARGTPVITTSRGALPELVEDGHTGIIVPPSDPRALADAVARLVGDASLARRMGTVARARYEERYTADANHRILMGIYERVLAGRP